MAAEETALEREEETTNGQSDLVEEKEETAERKTTTEPQSEEAVAINAPRMTVALFIYWVVPVLFLAVASRFTIDTTPPPVKMKSRPISLDLSKASAAATKMDKPKPKRDRIKQQPDIKKPKKKRKKQQQKPPTFAPTVSSSSGYPSSYPTSYKDVLDTIAKRRRKFNKFAKSGYGPATPAKSRSTRPTPPPATTSATTTKSKPSPSPLASPTPAKAAPSRRKKQRSTRNQDPNKVSLEKQIETFRAEFKANPDDVWKALRLADALRQKDLQFHDGGMGQWEALEAYNKAIELTLVKRQKLIDEGEPTNRSLSGTQSVKDEIMFDVTQKSVDGLLCTIYTNQGKLYFMANMFEKAVESYTKCIDIEPMYLDAVGARGSSRIILGQYAEAAVDFTIVIENDTNRFFNDAFTGMAKVLSTKEEVVPQGWGPMVDIIDGLIETYEDKIELTTNDAAKKLFAEALTRLHHVMFMYHDGKTKDREMAWEHLSRGYEHKMSVLAPYSKTMEKQKLMTTKQVFHAKFWPDGIGSPTNLPIFIIGFVRSGSTLLERVLDAHPLIVGTGEDSVFNGRLDYIRDSIVSASMSGDSDELKDTVKELADSVALDMRKRWESIEANTGREESSDVVPERFADKMLTNYFNVGFIHMLYPKALILHVARNPMDVLWSAFKHEFPPGGLDYTSEFESLASMYHSYREVITHWDAVLPGRITHVRYEDMVNDMPGMARAIIDATGLPWDEGVLDFHKKKHAVNTLSTTQVRKGVYKHGMEAWRKYEKQLQPLGKLVGKKVKWDLKTSLPNYTPPAPDNEEL